MLEDLPKADPLLKAGDIVKYGTLALTHCFSDHLSLYHDITGIVYESVFYEV
jgi:hypothetical protein